MSRGGSGSISVKVKLDVRTGSLLLCLLEVLHLAVVPSSHQRIQCVDLGSALLLRLNRSCPCSCCSNASLLVLLARCRGCP